MLMCGVGRSLEGRAGFPGASSPQGPGRCWRDGRRPGPSGHICVTAPRDAPGPGEKEPHRRVAGAQRPTDSRRSRSAVLCWTIGAASGGNLCYILHEALSSCMACNNTLTFSELWFPHLGEEGSSSGLFFSLCEYFQMCSVTYGCLYINRY